MRNLFYPGTRNQPGRSDQVWQQDFVHSNQLWWEGQEGHVQEANQWAHWQGCGQVVQEGNCHQESAITGSSKGKFITRSSAPNQGLGDNGLFITLVSKIL